MRNPRRAGGGEGVLLIGERASTVFAQCSSLGMPTPSINLLGWPFLCRLLFPCIISVRKKGDVSSRLTATLQAILTASHFLGHEHAGAICSAARKAMDAAARVIGANSAEEEQEALNQWQGADLAALTLYALLHVSKHPREGVPVVIGVLQEMVRRTVESDHQGWHLTHSDRGATLKNSRGAQGRVVS